MKTLLIAATVALFAAIPVGSFAVHQATKAVVTAVVTDKERVTSGTGSTITSKYLIFTEKETFENTDSFWALKFNSSDIYGRLQAGQTCQFTVVGFRVAFMSSYRNIIEATCP